MKKEKGVPFYETPCILCYCSLLKIIIIVIYSFLYRPNNKTL